MRERPILFSGPMVRAILDGRKTQTRRIVKNAHIITCDDQRGATDSKCPYGVPGDRLWVKETFARYPNNPSMFFYRADNADPERFAGMWYPSIHMPRWASRITLEVVSVRVERVQSISNEDARAEGCPISDFPRDGMDCARDWFLHLFYQFNERVPVDSNPWVWVVEFKRIEVPNAK